MDKEIKPGVKTTEFAAAIVAQLASVGYAFADFFGGESHWVAQILALLISTLGALGYQAFRGSLKKDAAKVAAVVASVTPQVAPQVTPQEPAKAEAPLQ